MSGKILEAKPFIESELMELRDIVVGMDVPPKLLIVKVGDDQASSVYVNNKLKTCARIGVATEVIYLPAEMEEKHLIHFIEVEINNRTDINGCIIQLPLPKHMNENKVLEALDPQLDVDGFAKENLGKLVRGEETTVACTPRGIIDLLKFYNIPIAGKNVVIINRSTIVVKPLAMLFLNEDATVTVCHSKTHYMDLHSLIYQADIVVTAKGKPKAFKAYDFMSGTTIVDVSMNRDENGKLCGDIDKDSYERLLQNNCNIVPVPGGVGQTTVLSLIKNLLESAGQQQ